MRPTISTGLAVMICLLCSTCRGAPSIYVMVREAPNTLTSERSARWYTAVLVNRGNDAVSVASVPGPGGYVGRGRTFNCRLEEWNRATAAWRVRNAERIPGSTVVEWVPLQSGRSLDTCSYLMPVKAATDTPGACVRIVLRRTWNAHSEEWASIPFGMGVPKSTGTCPE